MTSKAQQARDYKAAHPLASVQHIGEVVGMDPRHVRRALRVGPESLAQRCHRMRVAQLRKHENAPARAVLREMSASGEVFTLAHLQARAKCSHQSARKAIERAVEAGTVERAEDFKRGQWSIYRGVRAATGSQAA